MSDNIGQRCDNIAAESQAPNQNKIDRQSLRGMIQRVRQKIRRLLSSLWWMVFSIEAAREVEEEDEPE